MGLALSALILTACGSNASFSGNQVKQRVEPDRSAQDAVLYSGQQGDKDNVRTQTAADAESQTVARTFFAREVKTTAAQFRVESNAITYDLKQTDLYLDRTVNLQQISRRSYDDSKNQGSAATTASDPFDGNEYGILDILIVIDSSLSMMSEQTKVLANMPALISQVEESDWRIGIVTTDPEKGNPIGTRSIEPSTSQGCLRKIIHKSEHIATPDGSPTQAEIKFAEGIDAGLNGTGNEQGIRMALEGLTCQYETGKYFLRPNSTVAVLIISDEDNCSNGSCNGKDWGTATEADWPGSTTGNGSSLIQYLHTVRPDQDQTAVFGLIALENNDCPSDSYNEYKGITYMNVINTTGGFYASACGTEADYTNTLTNISQSVQNILRKTFPLTSAPYREKAEVYKGPKTEANDANLTKIDSTHHTVAGNQLTFVEGHAPLDSERIVVKYTVTPSTLVKQFDLTAKPDMSTLRVSLDGAVQAAAKYEVVEESGKHIVKFVDYPADNAVMRAEYRENTPLPKTFDIGDNVRTSSVRAYVNDVEVATFTINKDGELTFAHAPGDEANLRFTYQESQGPVLDYEMTFIPDDARNITVTTGNGEDLDFTIDGANLSFDPADHVTDRSLKVNMYTADEGRYTWTLGHPPIVDSIAIGGTDCKLGEGIQLSGKNLIVDCDFQDDADVTIAYKYESVRTQYRVDEVNADSLGKWTVWIDGVETTDFMVEGNIVTLSTTPEINSEVEIRFAPPII